MPDGYIPVRLPLLAALAWLEDAPGRAIVRQSGLAYRITNDQLVADPPMGWPDGPPLSLRDLRGPWDLREG